jgi:hypothetical protein
MARNFLTIEATVSETDSTTILERRRHTDHCLVVATVRERLAVNKQRSHRFHMERFNLKKLNEGN